MSKQQSVKNLNELNSVLIEFHQQNVHFFKNIELRLDDLNLRLEKIESNFQNPSIYNSILEEKQKNNQVETRIQKLIKNNFIDENGD